MRGLPGPCQLGPYRQGNHRRPQGLSHSERKSQVRLAHLFFQTCKPSSVRCEYSDYSLIRLSQFDPVSKRITAEVEKNGRRYTACKGAPNSVLKLTNFDPDVVKTYRAAALDFARRGFRSLGVAVKEDGKEWELLGIMSMLDPPRADTKKTIGEAIDLGISIKMLTGDAAAIAKETCRALGIGQNIFDSQQLLSSGMDGSDIRDFVEHADGFAEVFPEHKYQVSLSRCWSRGHSKPGAGMKGPGGAG